MIDLVSGINLSSKSIESVVGATTPQFIGIKDQNVEFARGFPNMMLTIWGCIIMHRRFPTQLEFTNYFINVHGPNLIHLNEEAVKGRVYRTYASLMREIHFYSLVKESELFEYTWYAADKDTERGIDLQVGFEGIEYNICIYLATRRSEEFRKAKKNDRHTAVPNTIEVTLDLNDGNRINNWVFFTPNHVINLFNQIYAQSVLTSQ